MSPCCIRTNMPLRPTHPPDRRCPRRRCRLRRHCLCRRRIPRSCNRSDILILRAPRHRRPSENSSLCRRRFYRRCSFLHRIARSSARSCRHTFPFYTPKNIRRRLRCFRRHTLPSRFLFRHRRQDLHWMTTKRRTAMSLPGNSVPSEEIFHSSRNPPSPRNPWCIRGGMVD